MLKDREKKREKKAPASPTKSLKTVSPQYSPESKYKIYKHQEEQEPLKKPKSPYLYFFEGQRKELKSLNPEWSALRINRKVKINWNKLSNDEKKSFNRISYVERKDYEEKLRQRKRLIS